MVLNGIGLGHQDRPRGERNGSGVGRSKYVLFPGSGRRVKMCGIRQNHFGYMLFSTSYELGSLGSEGTDKLRRVGVVLY